MRIFMMTAVVLVLAGCGEGTMPVKSSGPSEFLKMAPYPATPAWKMITDKSNPIGWIREWIPADQDESDIKDIVTAQVFVNQRGQDPERFLEGMFSRTASICGNARHSGKDHPEMTPHVAYMQIFCSQPNGQHQEVDMFIKAIAGKDALYVVQREFHYPQAAVPIVPGVQEFKGDEAAAMIARLNQIGVTNKWLDAEVNVCPIAGGGSTACTDSAPNVAAPTP